METLAQNWWALALRGAAAVLFGVLAFIQPGTAWLALVTIFGVYAIVDGVLNLVSGIRQAGESGPWWVLVIEGVLGIVAGIIAFWRPGLTALALLFLIAAWAIVTGVLEIAAAIRLRREIEGEWLLVLAGVVSIIFGFLLFAFPQVGALSVIWMVASYAIIFGVIMLVLAFRLRGMRGRTTTTSGADAGMTVQS